MAVNQSGGSYLPKENYDRTGATDTAGTYTGPTITSPSITGTITGGASITAPTVTSPVITGTVSGSATYTTPTFTGYLDFVEAGSTGTLLTNYGLSTIVPGASNLTATYSLSQPLSGSIKRVAVVTPGSTTATTTVQASTVSGLATFDGTNWICTFQRGVVATLVLNGVSTTRWIIAGSTQGLTFSTS